MRYQYVYLVSSISTFAIFNERICKRRNSPRTILWIPFVLGKNGCGMCIWAKCLILHNLCEVHNDTMPNELITAVQMYDREFQPLHCPADRVAQVHNNEQAGKENRQIFLKYFD